VGAAPDADVDAAPGAGVGVDAVPGVGVCAEADAVVAKDPFCRQQIQGSAFLVSFLQSVSGPSVDEIE
jgi:hypothetical protein